MVYVGELASLLCEPFVLVDMDGHKQGPFQSKQDIMDMPEYWYEVCFIYYDEDNKILIINI